MIPAPVLVAVGWVIGWLLLWRLPRLTAPPGLGHPDGTVSVVIPARDEEASLPSLLRSLGQQRSSVGVRLDVVVADDGSTDGTARAAEIAGATVVAVPPPPPGWLGKPWACAAGVRVTAGDVLVLLDADVVLAPGALDALLAEHQASAADGLLSVQPVHAVGSASEHLSLAGNLVALMGSGIGWIGRRPGRTDELAFGPCLVTTRAALERAGGFDAVAGELTEDVALARAYRAAGMPVACRAGDPRVSFRMYPGGLRPLVDGWTRHLAAGATAAPASSTLGAVLWVTGTLASTGLVGFAAADGDWSTAVLVWGAVAGQVRVLGQRVGSFRPWASLVYPVPVVAFVVLFARSWARRLARRPVVWRGRTVQAGGVVE